MKSYCKVFPNIFNNWYKSQLFNSGRNCVNFSQYKWAIMYENIYGSCFYTSGMESRMGVSLCLRVHALKHIRVCHVSKGNKFLMFIQWKAVSQRSFDLRWWLIEFMSRSPTWAWLLVIRTTSKSSSLSGYRSLSRAFTASTA